MISPELIRRYPFFGPFSMEQLSQIAMLGEELEVEPGSIIFEERQPADGLYLLLNGGVDLSFKSEEAFHPKGSKEFIVGEINPGEIFGTSALIEPYVLKATARAAKTSQVVRIDAAGLRALMDSNPQIGYLAMQQIAEVLMERLAYTRVQLAAAWA